MDQRMDFTFSDTIAGYGRRRTRPTRTLHAADDRRPRVRGRSSPRTTVRRGDPQPGRGLHRRHRPDARHARPRAAILFAYGVFYPEGGDHVFEAKHIVFVGRTPHEFVFERPDWWVSQIREIARLLPASAQFGPTATIDYRNYRTQHHARGRQARRATRQETDTISRLVYGFATAYLLTGEDRSSKPPRRAREYLRDHMRCFDADEDIVYWYHGIDVAGRQASRRSSPRSSATTTTRSRPTSRSTPWPARRRPTASPATRGSCSDIEMTHRRSSTVLPRPRAAAATSRTSTRSRSTRAPSRSATTGRARTGTRSATTPRRT